MCKYALIHILYAYSSGNQRDYNVTFDRSDDVWLFYEAVTFLRGKYSSSNNTVHTVASSQATCRSALVFDDVSTARRA